MTRHQQGTQPCLGGLAGFLVKERSKIFKVLRMNSKRDPLALEEKLQGIVQLGIVGVVFGVR